MNHTPTIKPYSIGFVLSILLTCTSFLLTFIHVNSSHETIPHEVLFPLLICFAFTQLIVQLIFFLHLLQEKKPYWNVTFFISTLGLVLLVVIMSLWIMGHLNHNMTPQDMSKQIIKDEGIHY